MSEKGTVFQKGGGGTNFEQYVQAAFLTTLIIQGSAPCIEAANQVIEIALQTTNRGCETDDVLVIAKSIKGNHRLLIQIKHNIVFSENDQIFSDVISTFWKDFNKPEFDKQNDQLVLVKNRLNNIEKNHIKGLINYAKTHSSANDFISEVNRIKEKKERLKIFEIALTKANNDSALSTEEIWKFLRSLDLIGYDFLSAGSVDETNFLNLIQLSKSDTTPLTSKEIWDAVIAYITKLNPSGGSVTHESIRQEMLFSYFNPSKTYTYSKSLEKLRNDSMAILKPMKDFIGSGESIYHIPKMDDIANLIESVNSNPLTIITGKPGVGKSALVKDALQLEFTQDGAFAFRADQFNQPHIANVFSNLGISESIQDILTFISLTPRKTIVIDSLEKLLEDINPENAFKQLLILLKEYKGIKLIGTSRKYALELIFQKFDIASNEVSVIEVEQLDDDQLKIVESKFPRLSNIFKNGAIKRLLRSPKYLDLTVKALEKLNEELDAATIIQYKTSLWNALVKGSVVKNGVMAKREDAFIQIAVNRAREMKLFTKPQDIDEGVLELLETEDLIFQENRKYAVSHDILEDWALVKFITNKFDETSNASDFINSLGNEPAIRRGFRLWVEDYLKDKEGNVNKLIRSSIDNSDIERYWADEILIAVFKADDSSNFFKEFENELLANNNQFLNRCIHIIRTTCKESNTDILLPIGSGWTDLIIFIDTHKLLFDNLRLSILNLLKDWRYRLLFDRRPSDSELTAVKNIVLHYIKQIEAKNEFWNNSALQSKMEDIISLLYDLADIAKVEIVDLIKTAYESKGGRWSRNSLHQTLIKTSLSYFAEKLAEVLPGTVIDNAWREWKLEDRKPNNSRVGYHFPIQISHEERWGISDHLEFFPSGIYKTPVYNLLKYHPGNTLKFIVDFLNYSVDNYRTHNELDNQREFKELKLILSDGTEIYQWGSWELWTAYRGHSVTHDCIESILVALEKYLFDLAHNKSTTSREGLKFCFDYLLRNSNSVLTTSVLNSVLLKYPTEIGEEMIALFSVKEFYNWDMSRSLHESTSLSPMDDKIPFAQKVRYESNQLPHRRNNIADIIVDHQFNIRTYNDKIHSVIDRFKEEATADDLLWKKKLNEIDARNWEYKGLDEKSTTFTIQPKYDKDVLDFLDDEKNDLSNQNNALRFSSIILKAYNGENIMSYDTWLECYNSYSSKGKSDALFDRRISLSIIGLRDLTSSLDNTQSEWCLKEISDAIIAIFQDTVNHSHTLNDGYNLMEKEIALKSFHYLMIGIDDIERNDFISFVIMILSAPFQDHELKYLTEYFRSTFSKMFPVDMKRIWLGLIRFAEYKKSNPSQFYSNREEDKVIARQNEVNFIANTLNSIDLDLDFPSITFDKYEADTLVKTLLITPYKNGDIMFQDFTKRFLYLLSEDCEKEDSHSYRNSEEREVSISQIFQLIDYFAEFLLYTDISVSKGIVDILIDSALIKNGLKLGSYRYNYFEFSEKVFRRLIYLVDFTTADSNNELLNHELIQNFWNVWMILFNTVKNRNQKYYAQILLLGIEWKNEATNWNPLSNRKEFYYSIVQQFGASNLGIIIDLFSSAGESTFLPDGLTWIVNIMKQNRHEPYAIVTPAGERLIKRLFHNHINSIKKEDSLINDFIWLLNNMVDRGSSQAYLYRESVIVYKKT